MRINDLILRRNVPDDVVGTVLRPSGDFEAHGEHSRAVTPSRAAVPARQKRSDVEVLRLLYSLQALGVGDGPTLLQFIGGDTRALGGSIADELAELAASQGDRRVLLINHHMGQDIRRPTLIEAFQETGEPDAAMAVLPGDGQVVRCTLSRSVHALLGISHDEITRLLDSIRRDYQFAILDSSGVGGPDGAALSRYCDGTVLIVESLRTTRGDIGRLRESVCRLGGRPIGFVLDAKRRNLPGWLERLIVG